MAWTKFERLDIATALERLHASTARVVVIGLPTSRNSSYLRASPDAPARVAAAVLREEGNPFAENGVDVSDRSLVRYLGALGLDGDDEFDDIRRVAAEAFRLGRHPLFIGGDHSVTYPVVAGLHDVHGAVDIVHVDAHPDLYDELDGNRLSHASPFARILEAGYQLQIPRMFAALLLICASGVAIVLVLGLVQHLILRRWHESALKREG